MKGIRTNIFLICVLSLIILPHSVSAKSIWVSQGSNGKGTESSPYGTIQEAADAAQPGDTVMIKPGVYYETVNFKGAGTEEKPIIFRASEFGKNKVILTGADRDIREGKAEWTMEDAERNIYSVPLTYRPKRILYNGVNLLRFAKYEYLAELKYVGVSYNTMGNQITVTDPPTYKEGYYFSEEEQKLYVRLRTDGKYGSPNPNENLFAISPQSYSSMVGEDGIELWAEFESMILTDSYNFGIISEKPAHTVLYGLTFETPGFTGVYVRASDVTVSNCWFEGCANGVHGGMKWQLDNYISDNVTVEYCEWHAWPYCEDGYELFKEGIFQTKTDMWAGKNVGWSPNSYEVGSLVGRIGENWVIRNNYVHDTLDGISFFGWTQWVEKIGGRTYGHDATSGEIYENRFENLADNAIEFETRVQGLDVHHNEMVNMLSPFSIQPFSGPPWPTNIKFHHNLIMQEPEHVNLLRETKVAHETFKDLRQYMERESIFKIGFAMPDNWNLPWSPDEMLYPGFVRPAKTLNFPDKGIQIYNNTIYAPNSGFCGFSGRMGGDRGEKSNLYFKNNIINTLVTDPAYANTSGTYSGDYWDLITATSDGRNTSGFTFVSNIFIPSEGQHMKEDATALESGGIFCESYESAGIEGITEGRIELSEDSPAIGKGTEIPGEKFKTTDIGACPAGEKWHINYAPYPYGDVNCDNVIDASDILFTAEHIGMKRDNDGFESRCDLDFNGLIDESDLTAVTALYANR